MIVRRNKQVLLEQLDISKTKVTQTGHTLVSTKDLRSIEFDKRSLENTYMAFWRYLGGNTSPRDLTEFEAYARQYVSSRL